MAEDNKTRSSVMLVILSDDLNPDQVTQVLDLVPSQAWRKGENHKFTNADGTISVYDSVYKWGGWKLWLPEELRQMPLMSQLNHWLQLVNERSAEVKGLKEQGVTIELNCCLTAKVYCHHMASEILAQFGELGIDLEITFYSPIRKPIAKRCRPTRSNKALHPTPSTALSGGLS